MIIGLTGSSGAGKSIAAAFFTSKGFFVIDYDKLSREIYKKGEPCLTQLTKHFGNDIIDEDGNVMRKKLGDIVFADKDKLKLLNNITTEHILKKGDILIEQNKHKDIVLDAPRLFEAGLNFQCDITVAIVADAEIQLERIVKRDSISLKTAKGRLDAQHDNNFFAQNCDYCISNNGTPKQLETSLENLLEILYDNCQ